MADIKKAEKDYMNGMKYKDIATKYNVSINTVKSWKTRYKWNKKGMHTNENVVHTKNKKVRTQKENIPPNKNEPVLKEVQELLNNTELNDKQRLFCSYYIRCFNATKAYQKAYGCDYITANTNGSRLLVNASVRREIEKLKQGRFNRAMLSEDDIFQKYLDIAFADTTEYSAFGNKEIKYIDGEGNEKTYIQNYVYIKNSDEVDGSLISEVSQGKSGLKIKLLDKMKALEWLANHKDLLTTEQKEKLKIEQAKVKRQEDNQEKDDVLKNMLEGLKNEL